MTRTRLAAAAALLLAACGDGRTDSSDLPLRIRVQPADTVAPGDSVRMTAHLVNPGRQPVRLEFEDQCTVVFYVMGPDKTVLHPPGGGAACMGAPAVLEVLPGDSIPFQDLWLVNSAFLGEHTAYAVLWGHHAPHEGERLFSEGHRSNIAILEVKAPDQ